MEFLGSNEEEMGAECLYRGQDPVAPVDGAHRSAGWGADRRGNLFVARANTITDIAEVLLFDLGVIPRCG